MIVSSQLTTLPRRASNAPAWRQARTKASWATSSAARESPIIVNARPYTRRWNRATKAVAASESPVARPASNASSDTAHTTDLRATTGSGLQLSSEDRISEVSRPSPLHGTATSNPFRRMARITGRLRPSPDTATDSPPHFPPTRSALRRGFSHPTPPPVRGASPRAVRPRSAQPPAGRSPRIRSGAGPSTVSAATNSLVGDHRVTRRHVPEQHGHGSRTRVG